MMTYGVAFVLVAILVAGVVLVGCSARGGASDTTNGPAGEDVDQHVCVHCGHIDRPRAQYCGHCGKEIESTGA